MRFFTLPCSFLILLSFVASAFAVGAGRDDLDKATAAKLAAETVGDLGEVIRLADRRSTRDWTRTMPCLPKSCWPQRFRNALENREIHQSGFDGRFQPPASIRVGRLEPGGSTRAGEPRMQFCWRN